MRVLICAATANEAKACELGVQDAGVENRVEVLRTGMGFERASHALQQRLKQQSRPDLIVSSGVAGSLGSELLLHSWVVANSIYVAQGATPAQRLPLSKLRDQLGNVRSCTVVSTNNLAFADDKTLNAYRDLARPLVVDMESAALARVANEFGIEFMVLRMISDSADSPLPHFAAEFASAMTTKSMLARLNHVVRGTHQALRDPMGVLRMTKEPRLWGKLLRQGWREYAGALFD